MIKRNITYDDVKKIFQRSKTIKQKYLQELSKSLNIEIDTNLNQNDLNQEIINTWNYDISKDTIRNLFKNTDKYKYYTKCKSILEKSLEEWDQLKLDEIIWPFQPRQFDNYVHRLNRKTDLSGKEKDLFLIHSVVKFRRIKDINAIRNDFIEYLIFENNDNIIPTFSNSSGVDFYIDGEPYDQKVSKSLGNKFKNQYYNNYLDVAKKNPELVGKSLYEDQDEARFDDNQRLYIVYLNEDTTALSIKNGLTKIENQIKKIDFSRPYNITFEYNHSNTGKIQHLALC